MEEAPWYFDPAIAPRQALDIHLSGPSVSGLTGKDGRTPPHLPSQLPSTPPTLTWRARPLGPRLCPRRWRPSNERHNEGQCHPNMPLHPCTSALKLYAHGSAHHCTCENKCCTRENFKYLLSVHRQGKAAMKQTLCTAATWAALIGLLFVGALATCYDLHIIGD